MRIQVLISFSFLLFLFYHCTGTFAQSPAQAPSKSEAQAPAKAQTPTKAPTSKPVVEPPSEVPLVQAPPHKALDGPADVSKVLEKAGGFSVFIRLLKSTSVIIQVQDQLNVSNTLTIFAPTNGAFSALKPGTLNSLSTQHKFQLVQYHILPTFVSVQNFQTLSNPVRTQAGNTSDFPLNIMVEDRWVNISTGMVNTTISGTVYEDNQLAIYKVDKVLLPLGIFASTPKPLAPAPTPVKPSKDSSSSSEVNGPDAALDASNALSLAGNGMAALGGAALFVTLLFMECTTPLPLENSPPAVVLLLSEENHYVDHILTSPLSLSGSSPINRWSGSIAISKRSSNPVSVTSTTSGPSSFSSNPCSSPRRNSSSSSPAAESQTSTHQCHQDTRKSGQLTSTCSSDSSENTQGINQIENQLNTSNSLTILAPTNGVFSSLKAGTLNSLTTEQKVQLVQYHILPSFISLSNFQTLSNPVRTQASNTDEYPLNITTQGNWVNLSTGLVNTSVSGTVYADNQLAIYKIDRVLLPLGIFAPRPKVPPPAPTLAKPNKESSTLS
ncbi:hypothetical protein TIFTF001_000661 [Ficus carica]|uniref:FAS1 domain-containing protein n=1 Tax=Ficus carica TaxID=3494 RepID=A0AA88D1Y4_FICCA|nr:hypothetical protein TIFTF001_000661 [Ficus carica]